MKRIIQLLALSASVLLTLTGCKALKTPIVNVYAPIEEYKYVYITPTKELVSGFGHTQSLPYVGTVGSSTTKSINPSDIISGELIKKGYVILPKLEPELSNKTLIINYGETGRRKRGLGYTIEITLQFLSADNNEVVCTCTAEGQGATEADDIRLAIKRALSGLFDNGKDTNAPKR